MMNLIRHFSGAARSFLICKRCNFSICQVLSKPEENSSFTKYLEALGTEVDVEARPEIGRGSFLKRNVKVSKQRKRRQKVESPNFGLQVPMTFGRHIQKSGLLTNPVVEKVYSKAEKLYLEHEANLMKKSRSSAGDETDWNAAMHVLKKLEQTLPQHNSVDKESLSSKISTLTPTYNLAKVVDDCPTLQRLVDLGVNISKWEKSGDTLAMAFSLNFERDVAPKARFLVDNGVKPDNLGAIFTENPDMFKLDSADMQVRINYLKWKQFDVKGIARILNSCPTWLNKTVTDVDRRLGYFQQAFGLSGKMVRDLAKRGPNLVVWDGVPSQVERNRIAITDNMEFDNKGAVQILLKAPEVYDNWFEDWILDTHSVLKHMYTNQVLLHCPTVLTRPKLDVKHKHLFLKFLKKDQYDPKKPNFVPPKALLSDDVQYCTETAKVPISLYNKFLLTV